MRHGALVLGAAFSLGLGVGHAFAETIEACGMLESFGGCVLLNQLGPEADSRFYRVDPAPVLLPDYPVTVRGELEECESGCYATSLCLRPIEITRCAAFDLGCGRSYTGPCIDSTVERWASPLYGTWYLSSAVWAMRDTSVHIWGWFDRSGGSICAVGGNGRVLADSVVVCADSASAVLPMSWGRVKSRYGM